MLPFLFNTQARVCSEMLRANSGRRFGGSIKYSTPPQALRKLPLAVTTESKIYGHAAYTEYQAEDDMREAELSELMIQRKGNSLRKVEPWVRFIKEQMRKGIETCPG